MGAYAHNYVPQAVNEVPERDFERFATYVEANGTTPQLAEMLRVCSDDQAEFLRELARHIDLQKKVREQANKDYEQLVALSTPVRRPAWMDQ